MSYPLKVVHQAWVSMYRYWPAPTGSSVAPSAATAARFNAPMAWAELTGLSCSVTNDGTSSPTITRTAAIPAVRPIRNQRRRPRTGAPTGARPAESPDAAEGAAPSQVTRTGLPVAAASNFARAVANAVVPSGVSACSPRSTSSSSSSLHSRVIASWSVIAAPRVLIAADRRAGSGRLVGSELSSDPMQPGPHRADRNTQGLRDFGAVQAGPCGQQQYVAVVRCQTAYPQRQPTDPHLRIHPVRHHVPGIGTRCVAGSVSATRSSAIAPTRRLRYRCRPGACASNN